MMTDWQRNQLALQGHLKHDKLEDFLNWSTIEKTMFVGDVDFVRKEYNELFEVYDLAILKETEIGNPKLIWGWTSGNLIHQLYHLKQWLDRSKQDISDLSSIVEIGAGYGAMALICYRLGFEGKYYIIDLPELVRLQRYYLWKTIANIDEIYWSSPLESCDLLIACHSLSEMPLSERERLLSQVEANEYLFASSYEFEGVDNATWLREFAESKLSYDWQQYAHPYQENALYQVGVKE